MSKEQAEQLQTFLLSFKKSKGLDELAKMKPKDIHQLLKDHKFITDSMDVNQQQATVKKAQQLLAEDDPLSLNNTNLPEPELIEQEDTEMKEDTSDTTSLDTTSSSQDEQYKPVAKPVETTSTTDVLSLMATPEETINQPPQPIDAVIPPEAIPTPLQPSEVAITEEAIHEALQSDEPDEDEEHQEQTREALRYIKRLRHKPNANPLEQLVTKDQTQSIKDIVEHDVMEITPAYARLRIDQAEQQPQIQTQTEIIDHNSVFAFLANLLLFPKTIIEDPLLTNITRIYNIDPVFIKYFSTLTPAQKLHFLVFSNIKDKFKEATKTYKRGSCEPIPTDINFNAIIPDFERHKPRLAEDKSDVLLADFIASNEFFCDPEDLPDKLLTFIQQHYDPNFNSSSPIFDTLLEKVNKINEELVAGCSNENETKLSFDITQLITDKFDNTLVQSIIYGGKKRGRHDPLIINDDMVIEAMLHIQRVPAIDRAVLKEVVNNDVFIQSGKTISNVASIVCPAGNEDLQVLKQLYKDDLLATKVQEFKAAVAKKTPHQVLKMLLDMKDPLVATMNETHRMFLLKFIKHYKSLDSLPLPFISPTFTRLTKLQDFPQFFQHSIKEYIEQENNWLASQAASIKQSIDKSNLDEELQLLNNYVKSVSDAGLGAKEKRYQLERLEKIIESFPIIVKGTNKYKSTQQIETEVDRLMDALHTNNFRPVYRAFHVYQKVQYKRMIDPFIPTHSLERRLKRRAAAEHPVQMIASVFNDTDFNKCMTYLRTKPWLKYGKDFQYYIRLPNGRSMNPKTSEWIDKGFTTPALKLQLSNKFPADLSLYTPTELFWDEYCKNFGPNVVANANWSAQCDIAEPYKLFLTQLRLGLVNLKTGEMIDLDKKHFAMECEYMKKQVHQSLDIPVRESDVSNKSLLVRTMNKILSASLELLKRRKRLVIDIRDETVYIVSTLVQGAISRQQTYRQLLETFFLIDLLLTFPGANAFQSKIALSRLYRKELSNINLASLQREFVELEFINKEEVARLMYNLSLWVEFQSLNLAADVGLIPSKRADYENSILRLKRDLYDSKMFISNKVNEYKELCSNKHQIQGDVVFYHVDPVHHSLHCAGFEQISAILNASRTVAASELGVDESVAITVRKLFDVKDDYMAHLNETLSQVSGLVPKPLTAEHEKLVRQSLDVLECEADPEDTKYAGLLIALIQQTSISSNLHRTAVRALAAEICKQLWSQVETAITQLQTDNSDWWRKVVQELEKEARNRAEKTGLEVSNKLKAFVDRADNNNQVVGEGIHYLVEWQDQAEALSRNDRQNRFDRLKELEMWNKLEGKLNGLHVNTQLQNYIIDKLTLDLNLPNVLINTQAQSQVEHTILNSTSMCQACLSQPYALESVVASKDGVFRNVRVCKNLVCFRQMFNNDQLPELKNKAIREGEIRNNIEALIAPYLPAIDEQQLASEMLGASIPANTSVWFALLLTFNPKVYSSEILHDRQGTVFQLYKRFVIDQLDKVSKLLTKSKDELGSPDVEYSPQAQLEILYQLPEFRTAFQAVIKSAPSFGYYERVMQHLKPVEVPPPAKRLKRNVEPQVQVETVVETEVQSPQVESVAAVVQPIEVDTEMKEPVEPVERVVEDVEMQVVQPQPAKAKPFKPMEGCPTINENEVIEVIKGSLPKTQPLNLTNFFNDYVLWPFIQRFEYECKNEADQESHRKLIQVGNINDKLGFVATRPEWKKYLQSNFYDAGGKLDDAMIEVFYKFNLAYKSNPKFKISEPLDTSDENWMESYDAVLNISPATQKEEKEQRNKAKLAYGLYLRMIKDSLIITSQLMSGKPLDLRITTEEEFLMEEKAGKASFIATTPARLFMYCVCFNFADNQPEGKAQEVLSTLVNTSIEQGNKTNESYLRELQVTITNRKLFNHIFGVRVSDISTFMPLAMRVLTLFSELYFKSKLMMNLSIDARERLRSDFYTAIKLGMKTKLVEMGV